jgi:Icc-related predicted phosphoesterase
MHCLFASDLHGRSDRYRSLFASILRERPGMVFIGGDLFSLLPIREADAYDTPMGDLEGFIIPSLLSLHEELGSEYPRVYVILGNDDGALIEPDIRDVEAQGLWTYVHRRRVEDPSGYTIYGYNYVPPTPFQLKDWERYDVSRFVDPGCVSPEEGWRSIPVEQQHIRYTTIAKDLEELAGNDAQGKAIWLFHTPPHNTLLDRAGLDGVMVDHAPVDVHVGSIAVRRFIESRQPLLTLHGHVHESAKLTGNWRDRIGGTEMFTGGHDGGELSLIRFDPQDLEAATRELLPWRP